jgi:hypothetical protein
VPPQLRIARENAKGFDGFNRLDNMLAYKQLKIKARLIELGRWLAPPIPTALSDDSSDWYTGLCVDPHGFTDQLCKLQNSLGTAQRNLTTNGSSR